MGLSKDIHEGFAFQIGLSWDKCSNEYSITVKK